MLPLAHDAHWAARGRCRVARRILGPWVGLVEPILPVLLNWPVKHPLVTSFQSFGYHRETTDASLGKTEWQIPTLYETFSQLSSVLGRFALPAVPALSWPAQNAHHKAPGATAFMWLAAGRGTRQLSSLKKTVTNDGARRCKQPIYPLSWAAEQSRVRRDTSVWSQLQDKDDPIAQQLLTHFSGRGRQRTRQQLPVPAGKPSKPF